MSTNYSIGDLLELRIEKIVPRGLGLAFAEGLTVFTALSAPGDLVRVRLAEIKGKTAFAEIEEVLEPSSERIQPPCEYFGRCGGCDLQQMSYEAQLSAKIDIIRDCLHRIAKIDHEAEIPIIASPEQFSYRMRAQWHADAPSRSVGYYERNSRDLVNIKKCLVLVPELNSLLGEFHEEAPWNTFAADRFQIDAAAGSDGSVSVSSSEFAEDPEVVSTVVRGYKYQFAADAFFQGNRFLVDRLVEVAVEGLEGDRVLDLYSGGGLFTLPLADRFRSVTAVEESPRAVEFAKVNAANAGKQNIEFITSSVRHFLASPIGGEPDAVLLDPPRAGTEKDTIMNLIGLRPKRVSYVACEPAVLARDLKRFVENGYSIASITALDMFPQTHHVETVVHLHS